MAEIHVLSDHLANQIAAGEVVERPLSVVKELVENSLDAQSTQIQVFLEEAGIGLIRVVDNGKGMGYDDAKRAFGRHATSKIQSSTDLFRVRTLGFRGEALPSIASVSEVTLITSDGKESAKVVVRGSEVISHEIAPLRTGTDICVRRLFYNTPARLKYLKTTTTELGHITDYINRMSLANPTVRFSIFHEEKRLFQTNGSGNYKEAFASVYGMGAARESFELTASTLDYELMLVSASPHVHRANRNYISIFVNGRYIKNYVLTNAIIEGFHTRLPINRFPISALFIQVDPYLVDANVHPTKMEVRFSKEKELFEAIRSMLIAHFQKEGYVPSGIAKKVKEKSSQVQWDMPVVQPSTTLFPEKNRMNYEDVPNQRPDFLNADVSSQTIHEQSTPVEETDDFLKDEQEETVSKQFVPALEAPSSSRAEAIEEVQDRENPTAETSNDPTNRLPFAEVVGQIHGTYWIFQNDTGIYWMDQHAAQERINYEYFVKKLGEENNGSQILGIPITIELSFKEAGSLAQKLHFLQEIGIEIESFGGNSFIVRSYPTWMEEKDAQYFIETAIDQLLQTGTVSQLKLRETLAIMMSCKASIKANEYVTKEGAAILYENLRKCDQPFTCPHGRPIIVQFTTKDIEKLFHRII